MKFVSKKIKRFGLCVLSVILIVSMSGIGAIASDLTYEDGYDAIIFEETFDGFSENALPPTTSFLNANGNSATYGNYQTIVTSPVDATTHGKVLKTNTLTGHGSPIRINPTIMQTLYPAAKTERAKHIKFEIDLLLDNTSQGTIHALRYADNAARTLVSFANGYLRPLNVDESDYIALNAESPMWVNFLFYIDCDAGSYTAYISITGRDTVKVYNKAFDYADIKSLGVWVDADADAERNPIYVDNMRLSTFEDVDVVYDTTKEVSIFSEDFSSYDTSDWSVTSGITVENEPTNSGRGLAAKTNTKGSMLDVKRTYMTSKYPLNGTPARYVKLEFDLMSMVVNNMIEIYGRNVNNAQITPNFVTINNSRIRIGNKNSATPTREFMQFEANKWYSFDIYVDTTLNVYYVYVNGVYAGQENILSNGGSVGSFRAVLSWLPATAEPIYIDNYKITVIDELPANYAIKNVPTITREGDEHGKVHYTYNGSVNDEVTLIASTIKDDTLKGAWFKPTTITTGTSVSASVDFIQKQDEKLNIFLWKNMTELTPILPAVKDIVNTKAAQ